MRKLLKYLGIIIAIGSAVAGIWHRFSYPDMTQVRWFIEFWYVWAAWFSGIVIGCFLYLYGDGEDK